jgi:hypothetical protein
MSPVTAEGSQSAPVNPESAQSAPAKASTSGNQQLRIAILVVVAALVGVGLWLAFGNSSNKHHPKNKGKGAVTTAIGPVAFSKARLAKQPNIIDQPIYWAGPKKGYHYEFWRLKNDQVYVRYLPQNVKAGAPGKKYLIIGTYPFANAYHALKKQSHGRVTKGPNGSIIWTSSSDPHSVYIAWPGRRYQIEVYDPKASTAAAIAANGDVAPIG